MKIISWALGNSLNIVWELMRPFEISSVMSIIDITFFKEQNPFILTVVFPSVSAATAIKRPTRIIVKVVSFVNGSVFIILIMLFIKCHSKIKTFQVYFCNLYINKLIFKIAYVPGTYFS